MKQFIIVREKKIKNQVCNMISNIWQTKSAEGPKGQVRLHLWAGSPERVVGWALSPV